jgi:hypothetical protein
MKSSHYENCKSLFLNGPANCQFDGVRQVEYDR